MKRQYIFLACFFISACNLQDPGKGDTTEIKITSDTAPRLQADSPQQTPVQPGNLGDFANLLPVTILNAKSANVYEKYGIEFEGNCYSCDLAMIQVNKKYFDLVNVCDKKDFSRHEKFTYEVLANELKVKTEKNEFIFTQIGDDPIYELKISGDSVSIKSKRLARFFTPASHLKKFKQHECGEFDG